MQSSNMSLMITPGTVLMEELCADLVNFCRETVEKRGIQVVLSDGFVKQTKVNNPVVLIDEVLKTE